MSLEDISHQYEFDISKQSNGLGQATVPDAFS